MVGFAVLSAQHGLVARAQAAPRLSCSMSVSSWPRDSEKTSPWSGLTPYGMTSVALMCGKKVRRRLGQRWLLRRLSRWTFAAQSLSSVDLAKPLEEVGSKDLNALIVFAKKVESTLYVRVYSNCEFGIRNGSEQLNKDPCNDDVRFAQGDCIHGERILDTISRYGRNATYAFDWDKIESLRLVNNSITVVVTDAVGSNDIDIVHNEWTLNDTLVFGKRDGSEYIVSIQSRFPYTVYKNGKPLSLDVAYGDYEFAEDDCVYNTSEGYIRDLAKTHSIALKRSDSLVLEIDCLAIVIKSCIGENIVRNESTASINLKGWSNVLPEEVPDELFRTCPCFNEAEVAEIHAKCTSLEHLRTHNQFVLGHVGYKGDYASLDPMTVVDKNKLLQDHFQSYIDILIGKLSEVLQAPVHKLPYVFLPGFHYQDMDSPQFAHGRDISWGEFHTDGQHTRLQQQLGFMEAAYGVQHDIDVEQRYTVTCCITEGGMNIYPNQSQVDCERDDPHYSIEYKQGWLNIHSGRWVHQITPMRSDHDRICLQAHLVWCNDAERRGWLIYW